jgi:hypothetical protein
MIFHNCVGQVGGVVAPQLFQSKYAYNGYRTPFAICAGAMAGATLAHSWTRWLTKDVERAIWSERCLRMRAELESKVNVREHITAYKQKSTTNRDPGRTAGKMV